MTQGVQTAAMTGTVSLPQGTITQVTNSTTIVVSTTTTATCPTGSLTVCALSWGIQDDTTAINAARDAAWGNGNRCITYELPTDNFYFSGPIFNAPATLLTGNPCSTASGTAGTGSDLTASGPKLKGSGSGTTVLIPLSSWNFAGCTFGTGSQACNGTMPNLQAHDFAINGLGDVVGGTHAVTLWEDFGSNSGNACAGGTTMQDVNLTNWGLTSATTIGYRFGANSCNDAMIKNINVEMFGSQTCRATLGGNAFTAYDLLCFGAGANLFLFDAPTSAGAQLNTYGSQFTCTLAAGNVLVQGPASGNIPKWNSNGDFIQSFTGCPLQTFGITAQIMQMDFNEANITLASGTPSGSNLIRANNLGGVFHFKNSIVNATGANNQLFTSGATDKIFDDGGNTFTNGTVANTITAGTYFGSNSVTGTAVTAAKLVLSAGWGASAAWTALSGNTRLIQGTITNTGAGQAANPTITYTFPTPFVDVSSVVCSAIEVGGNQPLITDNQSILTPSSLTTTGVVFTYNGTPTVNDTEVIQISCDSK